MNDALIKALANRIKSDADPMTIENVPIPLQEAVQEIVGEADAEQ